MELTNEQLEAVSGGGCIGGTFKCEKCGSKDIREREEEKRTPGSGGGGVTITYYTCKKCGYEWKVKWDHS